MHGSSENVTRFVLGGGPPPWTLLPRNVDAALQQNVDQLQDTVTELQIGGVYTRQKLCCENCFPFQGERITMLTFDLRESANAQCFLNWALNEPQTTIANRRRHLFQAELQMAYWHPHHKHVGLGVLPCWLGSKSQESQKIDSTFHASCPVFFTTQWNTIRLWALTVARVRDLNAVTGVECRNFHASLSLKRWHGPSISDLRDWFAAKPCERRQSVMPGSSCLQENAVGQKCPKLQQQKWKQHFKTQFSRKLVWFPCGSMTKLQRYQWMCVSKRFVCPASPVDLKYAQSKCYFRVFQWLWFALHAGKNQVFVKLKKWIRYRSTKLWCFAKFSKGTRRSHQVIYDLNCFFIIYFGIVLEHS